MYVVNLLIIYRKWSNNFLTITINMIEYKTATDNLGTFVVFSLFDKNYLYPLIIISEHLT